MHTAYMSYSFRAGCQQTCMTDTSVACTVKISDDGQRNCPKHVEFYSKNKFEKLVHLVRFFYKNFTHTNTHKHAGVTSLQH